MSSRNRVTRFTAAYDGECVAGYFDGCHGSIYELSEAGYIDDELACEACCEEAESDNEATDPEDWF